MRVTRVRWTAYRVPFRREFVSAAERAAARHGLLLRVEADNGLTGLGEVGPVGAGDESSVWRLADDLSRRAPTLTGATFADIMSIADIVSRLDKPVPASVRFGVETALLDLLGKLERKPLATLLGGAPRRVPVNALISATSPEQAARDARQAVADGFHALKVKVGAASVDEDIRILGAVRDAVGPNVALRADANAAWSGPRAIEALRRMERFGLEYVEQPVGDMAAMAAVCRAVAIPIAADELLASVHEARRLLALSAAGVFIVKAARTGLLGALEIARLAARNAVPVVVTSSLETGVGIAASLHIAAAKWRDGSPACGLATGALLASDLLVKPLAVRQGSMTCPDAPGLGVDLDEAAVARYTSNIIV